jgi:thiol-disulfide isomerase/thioredoxin
VRREDVIGLLKDWGIAAGLTVAVLATMRLVGFGVGSAPVVEGEAPALVVPAPDGTPYDLAAEDAKVVVVNFWATWCGPCRQEIPEFSAFADAHPDVAVLGVSVDEDLGPKQVANAAKRPGITYDVLHDRQQRAARAWGVSVFPTTFVLDAERHVVASFSGTIDRRTLERATQKAGGD